MDIRGTLLKSKCTNVDIGVTLLKSKCTNVDIRGTLLKSKCTNVDIRGTLLKSKCTNVDIRGTLLKSKCTNVDIRGTLLKSKCTVWWQKREEASFSVNAIEEERRIVYKYTWRQQNKTPGFPNIAARISSLRMDTTVLYKDLRSHRFQENSRPSDILTNISWSSYTP